MSQLSKAIKYFDTGDRIEIKKNLSLLFADVFDAKSSWQEDMRDGGIATVYSIGIKLATTTCISETESLKSANPLQEAVDRSKRQLIEAVFGEFRPHFRRIEIAIYNHDTEEAGRLLREMEKEMYE